MYPDQQDWIGRYDRRSISVMYKSLGKKNSDVTALVNVVCLTSVWTTLEYF